MKKIFITFIVSIILFLSPTVFAVSITRDFLDVKEGGWYYGAVQSLWKQGIIKGYPDNTFKPARLINRAENAVMLNRAFKRLDKVKEVKTLIAKVEALETIISTLDLSGECYYEDKWYKEGEEVETKSSKGVINFVKPGFGECTCKTGGAIEYIWEVVL